MKFTFIFFIENELVTPPLTDGLILPGVTRDSLLEIACDWNEFKVTERYPTMEEIRKSIVEKRVSFFMFYRGINFNYLLLFFS